MRAAAAARAVRWIGSDKSTRTRKETRDLIEEAGKETRDLIKETRKLIDKNRDLIERNHGVVISMLGDTRERLARIEGHLGIGLPATDDPETDGNNREAA